VPPRDFGPDYPAFLLDRDGTPIPLHRERRWSRQYRHPTRKLTHLISRFYDGSASISFVELSAEWPHWTVAGRHEFSSNCRWLESRADFVDMLRFLLREGDPNDWSSIALSVARAFSSEEGFALLGGALDSTPIEQSANLLQAISMTRHPSAVARLTEHFENVGKSPAYGTTTRSRTGSRSRPLVASNTFSSLGCRLPDSMTPSVIYRVTSARETVTYAPDISARHIPGCQHLNPSISSPG
jgi:hypothetical protein